MLARQQRRRHHDRDLQAGQRGDEGRAQRHLGLAEADVAAHQPVHRLAGGEIVQHGLDAGAPGPRSPRRGSGRRTRRRRHAGGAMLGAWRSWRSAAILISSSAISRRRCLRRALRVCQPTPPSRSSCAPRLGRAVARQQLDVLDRQVELVAARRSRARRQSCGAPSAVMVVSPSKRPMPWSAWTTRSPTPRLVASVMTSAARRALRRGRTSRSPRMSCSAMTARSARLEALLEAEHGERRRVGRQRQRLGVALDLRRAVSSCSASSVASRSRAPGVKAATITRRPAPAAVRSARRRRRTRCASGGGALGREVAPGPAAERAHRRPRARPAPARTA